MALTTKTIRMNRYNFIPIATATTPKDGHMVMLNRWWAVKDGAIIFYGDRPQCNLHKSIVERSKLCVDGDAKPEFIPIVFVEHNCHDYA